VELGDQHGILGRISVELGNQHAHVREIAKTMQSPEKEVGVTPPLLCVKWNKSFPQESVGDNVDVPAEL
jgi:hypothetical protein